MPIDARITQILNAASGVEQPCSPKTCIGFLDLTSLNQDDDNQKITTLVDEAIANNVAAVCIYPAFLALAKTRLASTEIKLATVVNFPEGNIDHGKVVDEIQLALAEGADEIDIVFPYKAYLSDKVNQAMQVIIAAKDACGDKALKVILESGAFPKVEPLYQASRAVLIEGADFLKTSTGKIPQGASLEAAATLLLALTEHQAATGETKGCKISGGVRTWPQAEAYLKLAYHLFDESYLSAKTFRIGASSLLTDLLSQ